MVLQLVQPSPTVLLRGEPPSHKRSEPFSGEGHCLQTTLLGLGRIIKKSRPGGYASVVLQLIQPAPILLHCGEPPSPSDERLEPLW